MLEIGAIVGVCILLHFMIAEPAGYPLTIAPAGLAVVFGRHYRGRFEMREVAMWIVVLLVPFATVIAADSDTLVKFLRTYALYALNATVIYWACRGGLTGRREVVPRAAFVALVIVAGVSAAQSALSFATGSTALYNLFGSHQYLHPYDADTYNLGAGSLSRAQGFYLEPSFDALVLITTCIVCLLADYRPRAAAVITAVALCFNQSFSGILTFVLIMALELSLSFGRQVSRLVKLMVGIAFLGLALVAIRHVLISRLSELTVTGASSYYRLISPLIVLRDVLTSHPFGVEMGQVEAFLAPYGLVQLGSEGNTLDNGWYVLVFYFGWIGVAALASMLVKTTRLVFAGNRRAALCWAFVFLSMGFSGGILVPEYAFLLLLVIYQYRAGSVAAVVKAPARRSEMVPMSPIPRPAR
jgi:putative colanic acid polymerase